LPIREDTESWACASNVRKTYLRVVFAGNTTGWHRKGIIGLRVDLYPQQLCRLMQSPSQRGYSDTADVARLTIGIAIQGDLEPQALILGL